MLKLANKTFNIYSLSVKNGSRNYSKLTSSILNNNQETTNKRPVYFPDRMEACTDGKKSYVSCVSKFPLVSDRVFDKIYAQAEAIPDKLVYAFPHQQVNLTFGELKQRVSAMVGSMQSLGLQKGDRVAFALPNCFELVICYFAATQLGLIAVVLNPAYQVVELEYMLNKTKAKAFFIYDTFKILNHIGIMQKLCPELESSKPGEFKSKNLSDLKHIIVLNSPLVPEKKTYKGTWQYSEFSKPKSQSTCQDLPYVDTEDPCTILFTSGTTGKPKGAVLTHHGMLNSCFLSSCVVGEPLFFGTICNPIPFFHIMGLVSGFFIPLQFGMPKVFPFYFPDTLFALKAIAGYKARTMRGTPTQFIDLINHPERNKYDLSSLKVAIIGGASVPSDLLAVLKEKMGFEAVIVGYGMTETSFCHSLTHVSDCLKSHEQAYESVGRPVPYTETKIIDPKTRQVQPLGVEGELLLRGPHIIKKYWEDETKTSETFDENGWLKTGDIASMDAEGYLYFKSREKDVIIRGGANLYPAEIESFLRTNPSVLDAQVFGVPDERHGEEICAWIRKKPDSKLDEEGIKAFCKEKISHFKIPRYIKFVDSFPINANQKILKNVMKDMASKELNLVKK